MPPLKKFKVTAFHVFENPVPIAPILLFRSALKTSTSDISGE